MPDSTMLAAVYHGPNNLIVEEVPVPRIGPGELLLKVHSASICGTDLRILHGGHRKFPEGTVRIPGHEVVGEVAGCGAGVSGYPQGKQYFVAPNWGCGSCRQCVSGSNNMCANYGAFGITHDGSFAGYLRLPEAALRQGNLIAVRDGADPAAVALAEPLACVYRGQRAVRLAAGDTVLIFGAGPIGLMHARLARLQGAARVIVTDLNSQRLAAAAQFGADRLVNPSQEDLAEAVRAETGGQGADVILVAAPAHAAQEQAVLLAATGGRINFFGGLPKDRPTIRLDSNQVHYKELVLTGTTGCSTADCWRAAELVNSGRIDLGDLVSLRLPLSQANAGFQAAEGGQVLKVVLQP